MKIEQEPFKAWNVIEVEQMVKGEENRSKIISVS